MDINQQTDQVLRLSFPWLIVAVAVFLLLGFLGGVVAQTVFPTTQPLMRDGEQIITTVQEVTVSPSMAAAEVVTRNQRSVFLIGPVYEPPAPETILGTGVLATSDGIVVTAGAWPQVPLQAYDWQGTPVALELVGYDVFFDLSYYRLKDGVFSPIDFARHTIEAGHQLLMLSAMPITFSPEARWALVQNYELPNTTLPRGLVRTMSVSGVFSSQHRGSPLLTDEGKLAGMISDTATGKAVSVAQIEESLTRLTRNQLSYNPLEQVGITIDYDHLRLSASAAPQFVARVVTVIRDRSAHEAGLRPGDVIIAIDDKELEWADRLPAVWSSDRDIISVTILRGGERLSLEIPLTDL